MRFLRTCLSLVCLLAMHAADVPRTRVAFKTYGLESGLRNLVIWCLMQDRDGFLWVGSEGGVYRYDGNQFKGYDTEQGLPSDEVLSLHQDGSGTLWVGTYRGLVRWNGVRFEHQGLPTGPIEAVLTGPDKSVWATTQQGPYRQTAKGEFVPVPNWPGGEATALWVDANHNRVWVASSRPSATGVQTMVYQWESELWRPLGEPHVFGGERIDALAGDVGGRLWARSSNHLWVMPPGETIFRLTDAPALAAGSKGHLAVDRQGHLWVPNVHNLLHLQGDTWEVLGTEQGYPTDSVRALAEDREGNLWIAGTGLHRRLGRGMLASYSASDGLPSSVVWAISRSRTGHLWVGTNAGACRALNGAWQSLPGTRNNVIRSFAEDRQGRLYMAGNTPEVLRFDPKTQSLKKFPVEVGRSTKRLLRIAIDRANRLWIATENAGLCVTDLADDRLAFSSVHLPEGDPNERFGDVHEDREGRIWASGSRGLALLEGAKWRRFTTRDGLKQDHLSYTRQTANGDLLIAYFEALGLARARLANGKLQILGHVDKESGLTQNRVYLMGEDPQGRLWVGSERGVDILSSQGTEHYGSLDGLPSDDCNAMAFLAEASGDVWIGTSGGLGRFRTQSHPGAPAPPVAVIMSVRAGTQGLPPVLDKAPALPFGQNTVEFTFAGLSFLSEGQVEHQVRLVGLENEWRTTTTREARYPALARGKYQFEVRARIAKGAWSTVAQFPFVILPPWWQRWWFFLLSILAGVSLVALVLKWRLRALQRHNRELEQLVTDRTQELKAANEALRSQSLTDPLTGLRNRRFLSTCAPADVAQVNRIHRSLSLGLIERLSANIDLLFLMVDVDHFKLINDEFGHLAGDLVLQQVADILRQATRDSDTVIRWGGEEFLVLARNACRKDSTVMAERMRAMVENHRFDLGEGRFTHRTCSIGYAFYPLSLGVPELFNWEQVVDIADQCLYAAKRGGRNAYVGVSLTEQARLLPFHRSGFIPMERLVEEGAVQVDHSPSLTGHLDWKFDKH